VGDSLLYRGEQRVEIEGETQIEREHRGRMYREKGTSRKDSEHALDDRKERLYDSMTSCHCLTLCKKLEFRVIRAIQSAIIIVILSIYRDCESEILDRLHLSLRFVPIGKHSVFQAV
jgi:hypothetical protein